MSPQTTIDPVRKRVTVPCSPADAFDLFTRRMHEWWPLATHSLAQRDAVNVTIEPAAAGGQIVEAAADGRTFVWGTVTVWEPGSLVAFSWHPGSSADEATLVEVSFRASTADDGGCEVELVHSGWERRADGLAARADYEPGWDVVLARFVGLGAGG